MGGAHRDEGVEFKDRAFSVAELRLVQDIVAEHGRLSRRELANTVCELLDWRRPHGGLKTWEAKELLAVLEDRGLLRLPPLRTTKPRGAHTAIPRTGQAEPGEPLVARLDELTPLSVRPVGSLDDRRLWRELVARYHPRGHRVPHLLPAGPRRLRPDRPIALRAHAARRGRTPAVGPQPLSACARGTPRGPCVTGHRRKGLAGPNRCRLCHRRSWPPLAVACPASIITR